MTPDFDTAVREWTSLLGESGVRSDADTIGRYGRTTLPRGTTPRAVLLPTSAEQVQAIVRTAGRCGVPLHPISRGRNWGYGDRCAPGDGQVIVDLARMNRIVEVNEKLAYAVIEPGVTQGQLHDHLAQHHPGLWMDVTGAGREASIIGNTLDRGFGHTPTGDHFANTCGMEIVLPSGELLRTSFGHFTNAHATHAYPYGVGPVLDGLFSQSNLGIVTRAGVWLTPAPHPGGFCAFFASAPREEDLAELIDRLRPLRMAGLVRSAIHVANDLRVLSSRMTYPWDRAGGKTPIPDGLRRELAAGFDLGTWNVSGAIYGTRQTVAATRAAVKKALRPFRVVFLNDRKLQFAQRATAASRRVGLGRKFAELLKVVEPAYGLLKGVPTDEFLRGVLWQSKNKTGSLDPLDCGVGLIWVSPVAPATGACAKQVVGLMRPVYQSHGFDFLITLTLITERSLCCVTNISFDRGDADAVTRAGACYEELYATLIKHGYPPYRTGPGGYDKLHGEGSIYWQTCRAIKAALDPGRIISPGRYIP